MHERLRWMARAVSGRVFLAHWAHAAALALLACPLLAAYDAWRPMPPSGRAAVALAWLSALLFTLGRAVWNATRARPSLRAAARFFELRAGIPHNRVINALDLSLASPVDASPLAAALVARSLDLGERSLASGLNRRVLAPERRRLHRALAGLLAATALLALAWLVAGRVLGAGALRFAEPFADHPPWSPTDFALSIHPTEPAVGDTVRLTIDTSGALPDSLHLVLRSAADRTRLPASPAPRAAHDSRRVFTATLHDVREPLHVYAEGSTGRSRTLHIVPTREPRLIDASVRVSPPPYTRAATAVRSLHSPSAPGDPIRAVVGSRLALRVTATLPLRADSLTISPAIPFDLTTERRTLTAAAALDQPEACEFRLDPIGESGVPSRDRRRLALSVVPDEPPSLALDAPPWTGRDLLAPAGATLRVASHVTDDFGLRVLALAWARLDPRGRWISSGLVERIGHDRPPIITSPDLPIDFDARLALPRLGIDPGDTLIITVLAMDTREPPFGPPQIARLGPIAIRIADASPGAPTAGRCDGWIEMPDASDPQESSEPEHRGAGQRSSTPASNTWESRPAQSHPADSQDVSRSPRERWPSPSHRAAGAQRHEAPADADAGAPVDLSPDRAVTAATPHDPLTPLAEIPSRADPSDHRTTAPAARDDDALDVEALRGIPEAYRDTVARYFRMLNAPAASP
jgi:hypothetical protein